MNPESFSLSGKVALVTGSTRGIGNAIAYGLASAGAKVILHGRRIDSVRSVVDGFRQDGLDAEAVAFDVTDETAVQQAGERTRADFGPIDVLVNNAGNTVRKGVQQLEFEEWRSVLEVNLDGVFLVTKSYVPQMIENGAGKIINVGSLMSEIARPNNTPYAASKGGIRMLTRALAVELGPENIQVNAIGPGYFTTALTEPLRNDAEFDTWLKSRTPLSRWGRVEELAGAAVFLSSEASSFVSGQIIYVDGGFSAAM